MKAFCDEATVLPAMQSCSVLDSNNFSSEATETLPLPRNSVLDNKYQRFPAWYRTHQS